MTSTTPDRPAAADEWLTPDRLVAAALSRLDRYRRANEARASLGSADGRLMWLFSDREPRTMRAVADALGLEQSTVNRQVNAALRAGLLRRFRRPGESAALLVVTDDGADRFASDLQLHLGLIEQALAALDEPERTQFVRLFAQFAAGYGAATERLA